jgi:TonB family protein
MDAATRPPGRRSWPGPLLLALLVLLTGQASGPSGPVRPPAVAPPEPPWLPVHPERRALLGQTTVYAVCFDGVPPRARVHPPLDLPPGDPLRRTGGILIAHCLVDPQGWVVQAQLLKGPDTPTVREALVRTLAQWRFEPARRPNGQPAAVHFVVTLRVERGA